MSEGYYEPTIEDKSNVTSLHAEMQRSRDYGDKTRYPDYQELRAIGNLWSKELDNELRSERAKADIQLLLSRIAFELTMRQNEIIAMEVPDELLVSGLPAPQAA